MKYDKETYVEVAFTHISEELQEKVKTFANTAFGRQDGFHCFITPESWHVDETEELFWDGLTSEQWELSNWGTCATPTGLAYEEEVTVGGKLSYKVVMTIHLQGTKEIPAKIPVSLFLNWHTKGARFDAWYASARTRASYAGVIDGRGERLTIIPCKDYSLRAWECTAITQPYAMATQIAKQREQIREQASKPDGYLSFEDYIIAKQCLGY
jgi:hypothetical protein